MSLVVAIDGPAGSGKSSVSRAVATQLGIGYLDTGAMYRAATWWVLHENVDPTDPAAVARAVSGVEMRIGTDPEQALVEIGEADVTTAIREPLVTANVSAVSAVPAVRTEMVTRQRAVAADCAAERGGVIVEGRDIGTTVLPDSPLKIFLTADMEARAARRHLEDRGASRGPVELDRTLAALKARDRADSDRKESPLRRAADAVVVDATNLDLEQVIEVVLALIRERLA